MTPILPPPSSILRPSYGPRFGKSRPRILPLPKGEGWGEGEQPAHLTYAPAFRLQPPAYSLQPLFLACATCYGQSDSPMARGMNWGIFSLLVIVATVLATFVVFFIYLARRSATTTGGRASTRALTSSVL